MKNKTTLLMACLYTGAAFADLDPDKFPRIITLPPQSEYQPGQPGPIFYIKNTNVQQLTTSDSEVKKTHIQLPPNPPEHVPHTQSSYTAPSYQESQPQIHTKYFDFQQLFIKNNQWLTSWKNIFSWQTGAFITAACTSLYTILLIKLVRHQSYVKRTDGWASFQEHVPPAHLSSLDSDTLANGLIEEIKRRYPPTNSSNIMPSLLSFSTDVQQEIEALHAFIAFSEWLSFFKLSLVLPLQKKLIARAKTKIERLTIFKEALSQWINNHVTRLARTTIASYNHSEDKDEQELLDAYVP